MHVCINCLSVEDRDAAFCANCGQNEFGKINKKGFLVAIPHGAGLPCQGCFEHEKDLKFRYYRYVVALIFWAQLGGVAGYFCRSCRWKQFAKNFSLCLVLGWWAFWCLFARNPAAIVVNLWALFAAPLNAPSLGAIDLEDIKAAAAEEDDLADMYAAMPSWLNQLEEGEIDLVITSVDYYSVLGVAEDSSTEVIKAAWRQSVKKHHPDSAGPDGKPELMPVINDAHTVLCSDRLRYAYDHRGELLDLDGEPDPEPGSAHEDPPEVGFGCRLCELGFDDAGGLASHVLEEHPGVNYSDAYVPLRYGVPADESSSGRQGWKCKHCDEHFESYSDALGHADDAHPDRIAVDPRTSIESVGQ